MQILVCFAVIAVIAFTLERLAPARELPIFRRGLIADGLYVVCNIGLRIIFTDALAVGMTGLGRSMLPEQFVDILGGQHILIQGAVIVVVLDFIAYWTHRGKHHYAWWWRLHETHHSSVDLDWFSSVRFHPIEKILDRTIYLLPLVILGASEEALLILAVVDASVASLSHANTKLRYGPLSYLIVSPELHRFHHSADPAHQGKNFGNNLSIFDWIFGTGYLTDEDPSEFGIGDPAYPDRKFFRQLTYAFRRDSAS